MDSVAFASSRRPITSKSVVRDELLLGLPHLGPHTLGESQLLKYLGYLRWRSFEQLAGIPIHLVTDGDGRRLYATFYHADIEFPLSTPPHAFGEGDRITFIGGLSAYGRNILDGYFALFRADDPRVSQWGAPTAVSRERFLQAGIPTVRLSNIFIAQETGPETLKIGQPANADFSQIPEASEAPDGYDQNRHARGIGRFFDAPESGRPTPAVSVEFEHPIDPDRDVNAAGLVYFGNFPAFFHVAERRALASLSSGGLPQPFVDRRGTLRRRVGWFGNARRDDQLRIRVQCALEPEPVSDVERSQPYGRMWFTAQLARVSDARLVAITTADRITPLACEGEVEAWRAYAASLA
jgi:probable biosynthetic protein (TIGR04098 family)